MLGSLSSRCFIRQEGDCGLCQNHVKGAAFASNYTEHVQSLVLWRDTPAFSGSQVPFKLMTHLNEQQIRANSMGNTWNERASRKEKQLCSKMKTWVPLHQLCVPTLIYHQSPYVRSLMLRGRMVRRLISLSSLPLPSTIPAAVYASQPQGPKHLLDSSFSLCGCSPQEVH